MKRGRKYDRKHGRLVSCIGAVVAMAVLACALVFVGVGPLPLAQPEQNGMTYRMPGDDAAAGAGESQVASDAQAVDATGAIGAAGQGEGASAAEAASGAAPTGTAADQVPAAYREVVQSGASNSTPLEDIPASSFEGFIVQSTGTDASRAALDAAAQAGAVQLAYDDVYYAESLADLSQYVNANQLEYAEPNYYMQLMDMEGAESVFSALNGAAANASASANTSASAPDGVATTSASSSAPDGTTAANASASALNDAVASANANVSALNGVAATRANASVESASSAAARQAAASAAASRQAATAGERDTQRAKAAVFHALATSFSPTRLQSQVPQTGSLVGGTLSNPAPGWPPNDPYFTTAEFTNVATMDKVTLPGQWYLSMTNVRGAWEHGLDGRTYYLNGNPVRVDAQGNADPVRVAVIDTGLYGTGSQASTPHEDFDYTHVAPGKSFVSEDTTDTADTQHHGTAVAGFIAAVADNGVGIAGIAPGVTIVPVKVTDVKDDIPALKVANALRYAVDEAHADVVNISIGGGYENDLQTLGEACQHAIDAGAIVVASGGNAGTNDANYPAAYDGVIGVGWVNDKAERYSKSNYGIDNVTVVAPGVNVLTTNAPTDIYTNAYVVGSGSSFAAPQVAALAAMCKAVYPEMTASVFESFLATYATDLGESGRDDYYGYGLVNIGATAKAVRDSQILPWYQVDFTVTDQNGDPIQNAQVTVTAATNIDWDANADASPTFEAGTLSVGDEVAPLDSAANSFRLHCGTYAYTVTADGHYAAHGTFTTHSARQTQAVEMLDAHRVTLNVMAAGNVHASDVQLVVTNGEREEQPVLAGSGTFVYDLASGSYSFALSGGSYTPVNGTFTVGEETLSIELLACKPAEVARVQLAFEDEYGAPIDASGVECAVLKGPNVALSPQVDGTYLLAKGHDYLLQAERFGYQDLEETLRVTAADDEQTASFTLRFERNRARFNVTDQQGVPISGATVTVENEKAAASPSATDPLLFNLPMGSYSYTVRAQGYVPVQGTLRMTTEETAVDVSMRMTAQVVSVTAQDESGNTVDGARTVLTASGSLNQIAPRQDGTWLLDPGDYEYIVYAEGYEAARAQFTVELDHPLSLAVPLAAKAEEQLFAGGTGATDDPYLIATEAQLRALANQTKLTQAEVEAGRTDAVKGCYQLLNDIVLRDGTWTPIGNRRGNSYIAFSGYFNGAGHTISGLDINSPNLDYQGLFGYIRCGRVVNLTVDGEVIGRNRVGGLVGAFECTVETQAAVGDVVMSVMYRCCSTVTVAGAGEVGGLCGYVDVFSETSDVVLGDYGKAAVQECCSRGNVAALVEGDPSTEAGSVGGLLGYARRLLVYDCYSTGEVIGGYNVGGLLGNTQMGTVRTSYSSGIVALYVGEDEPLDESHDWFVGQAANTQFTSCVYLTRNGKKQIYVVPRLFCGNSDAAGAQIDWCNAYPYSDMYRSDAFVSEMNICYAPYRKSTAFTMGRAFPLLSWQAPEGTLLASAPYVITQPQSNLASEAYPLDKPNLNVAPLVAETNEVGEDGTLHWQWYESEYPNGADAIPIDDAEGAGTHAAFTPPVDEDHRGITYYYCLFVNTVSDESSFDTVSVRSDVAAIHVRLYDQALAPQVELDGAQDGMLQTRLGETPQLQALATSPDGGDLTYEWYRISASASGRPPSNNSSGSLIESAMESAFAPLTNTVGSYYVRVRVTNTRELGNSAFTLTNWVRVDVADWTISSYADLTAFRDVVNAGTTFANHTVQLADDILIPDGVSWTPIGTQAHPFAGTFIGVDPNNPEAAAPVRKITGLSIDGDACGSIHLGLFGYVRNGTLRNVCVQGELTGRANVFAGLLAGYISAGSMGSSAGSVTNCGTLEGSYVEGRCGLGGLVGFSGASIVCCANHANVKAWPCTQAEHDDLAVHHERMCALGGIAGYVESRECRQVYNAGIVEVAESGANGAGLTSQGCCPSAVGGVIGSCYQSTIVTSAYNAGQLIVPALISNPSDAESGRVLFCATVVGYTYATSLGDYKSLYYLTPWVDNRHGLNNEGGQDTTEMHSLAFMKTAHFVSMLNGQSGEITSDQIAGNADAPFVDATDSQHVPYLYWEDGPWNVASDDGKVRSAEPLRGECELLDFHELSDDATGSCYQGTNAAKAVATFTPVENGTLKVTWQRKEIGQTSQSDWQPVPVDPLIERQVTDAQPVTFERAIDTSTPGVYELRARAVSKRADSDVEDDSPAVYSPVFTITVLEPTDEMKAERAYDALMAEIGKLGSATEPHDDPADGPDAAADVGSGESSDAALDAENVQGVDAITTANVAQAQQALSTFDAAINAIVNPVGNDDENGQDSSAASGDTSVGAASAANPADPASDAGTAASGGANSASTGVGGEDDASASDEHAAGDSLGRAVSAVSDDDLAQLLDADKCAAVAALRAAVADAAAARDAANALEALGVITTENESAAQAVLGSLTSAQCNRLAPPHADVVAAARAATAEAQAAVAALVNLNALGTITSDNAADAQAILNNLTSAQRARLTAIQQVVVATAEQTAATASEAHARAASLSALGAINNANGNKAQARQLLAQLDAGISASAASEAATLRDFLGPNDAATVAAAQTAVNTREPNTFAVTRPTAKFTFVYNLSTAQTIAASKLYKVAGAKGALSFAKASASSVVGTATKAVNAGKFTVDSNTGRITIAKGAPADTYTVKVTVTAAGDIDYLPSSTTLAYTIVVGKAVNPLAAKVKTAKFSLVFNVSSGQTLPKAKLYNVSGNQGTVTYSIASVVGRSTGVKNKAKFKITSASTGAIALAKGTPADVYTVKVNVKAAGNGNYNAATVNNLTYTVTMKKAANPISVKAKTTKAYVIKADAKTGKTGKVTTYKATQLYKVVNNKSGGAITYKASVPSAAKKFITVSKNGAITVKKGLKRGKYTLTLKATQAATANYNKSSANPMKITIQVK